MRYRIRHISRQGITENIQFLSRSERVWLLAEQHRRAIIAGILVAALVAVVAGAILWFQSQRAQEAAALEDEATHAYLDRAFDGSITQEKLETAERLYRQVIEEFSNTPSAPLAGYLLGNVLVEQQDYAGAIEAYQHVIEQGGDASLIGVVYQRLGATYLANDEYEKGIQAYEQVLQLQGALNQDQVTFELAKLEEFANHTDQALAHYNKLIESYGNSPLVGEATLQINRLEALLEGSEEGADGGVEGEPTAEAGDSPSPVESEEGAGESEPTAEADDSPAPMESEEGAGESEPTAEAGDSPGPMESEDGAGESEPTQEQPQEENTNEE